MFIRKTIMAKMSPIKKSFLQTTNMILWILTLFILILLGNLILKISTYGVETGIKSTAFTYELLVKPLYSPLKWTSDPKSSFLHLVMNLSVFYVVFTFGFWIKHYYKMAGMLLLLTFIILSGIWYYVYVLSDAVI
ncbi:hypothetical protein [Rossellomorea sp. NS-SX7]|uniref:hypothetical protein n=1 Tax=Rossellomorea sp. NS-SX7 TaxID=3463856 RepID=UPI00405978B5